MDRPNFFIRGIGAVFLCWMLGLVVLSIIDMGLKIGLSRPQTTTTSCESYADVELMKIPARCLKYFQYEEDIIEVSINGEVQEYPKNASGTPVLSEEQQDK